MVKAEVKIIDPYRPELNKTYICYPTETHIISDGTTTYEFNFNFQFPAIPRRSKKMTNEEVREHMDMLIAHKDKALETHPYFKRCDSCIHSEEQDGHSCYECIKNMADNFEAQPTSDDDIIKALKAVRTIHNGNYAPQIDEAIRRLEASQTVTEFADKCKECGKIKEDLYEKGFEAGKRYIVEQMCALLEKEVQE